MFSFFWKQKCFEGGGVKRRLRETDNFSSFSTGRKSIFAAPWHPTIYRRISENVRKCRKKLENVRSGSSRSNEISLLSWRHKSVLWAGRCFQDQTLDDTPTLASQLVVGVSIQRAMIHPSNTLDFCSQAKVGSLDLPLMHNSFKLLLHQLNFPQSQMWHSFAFGGESLSVKCVILSKCCCMLLGKGT